MQYPVILNGDHAEFEREHANTKPEDRPDWPLPSFNATDWAKAFCKIATNLGYRDAEGKPVDEGWMITWFANALMRGFDHRAPEIAALATQVERAALNHKDMVETKRKTDNRLRIALTALQTIYDTCTDEKLSKLAGDAFNAATEMKPVTLPE